MNRRERRRFLEIKDKQLMRMSRELKNLHEQNSTNYVELEKPVFIGYEAEYVVKKEWEKDLRYNFLVQLSKLFRPAFCQTKNFIIRRKEGKKTVIKHIKPRLDWVSRRDFENLPDEVRELILEKSETINGREYVRYVVEQDVIDKFFRLKKKKKYWTHVGISQSEIESKIAFLEKKISEKGWTRLDKLSGIKHYKSIEKIKIKEKINKRLTEEEIIEETKEL